MSANIPRTGATSRITTDTWRAFNATGPLARTGHAAVATLPARQRLVHHRRQIAGGVGFGQEALELAAQQAVLDRDVQLPR
jgi:hypothetical protein